MKKDIYIFIDDQTSQKQHETESFEDYINTMFSDYVLLLTEERDPINDEEEDHYFIVEF